MKPTQLLMIFALICAMAAAFSAPLQAGPIKAHWSQVCGIANGRELTITTANGETEQGRCAAIDVSGGLRLRKADGSDVVVERILVTRIVMGKPGARLLRSLGDTMSEGLGSGIYSLLTPYAPYGILVIAGTLAYGAIAAPFCLLGDLFSHGSGTQEIQVI
jgi:hypothetical protein